jgi:hypothetical protein
MVPPLMPHDDMAIGAELKGKVMKPRPSAG